MPNRKAYASVQYLVKVSAAGSGAGCCLGCTWLNNARCLWPYCLAGTRTCSFGSLSFTKTSGTSVVLGLGCADSSWHFLGIPRLPVHECCQSVRRLRLATCSRRKHRLGPASAADTRLQPRDDIHGDASIQELPWRHRRKDISGLAKPRALPAHL